MVPAAGCSVAEGIATLRPISRPDGCVEVTVRETLGVAGAGAGLTIEAGAETDGPLVIRLNDPSGDPG